MLQICFRIFSWIDLWLPSRLLLQYRSHLLYQGNLHVWPCTFAVHDHEQHRNLTWVSAFPYQTQAQAFHIHFDVRYPHHRPCCYSWFFQTSRISISKELALDNVCQQTLLCWGRLLLNLEQFYSSQLLEEEHGQQWSAQAYILPQQAQRKSSQHLPKF